MSIVKVFTPASLLDYLASLNPNIPVPLNTTTVALSSPVPVTGTPNTQLTVSGTGLSAEPSGDVYVGQFGMRYTRLSLNTLFLGVRVEYERDPVLVDQTLYEWLDTFSQRHGVRLTQDDVEDTALGNAEGETVRVYAKGDSVNFTGFFDIAITDQFDLVDIATLNPVLDIYYEDLTPSDFHYGYVNGVLQLLPFNGARLTVGWDFSAYSDYLDELTVVNELRAPRHQAIIKLIMLMEFGIDLQNMDNERIIISQTILTDESFIYLKVPGARDYLVFRYVPSTTAPV